MTSNPKTDTHAKPDALPKRKRIYLIDAKTDRLKTVASALGRVYTVRTFSDGGAALDAMYKSPPNLVLIDEATLSKRGQGIHKTKTRDNLLKFIPFIILSNLTEGPLMIGDGAGAPDHYLKRPFSSNRLLEQISSCLSHAVERSWKKLPKTAQQTLKYTMDEFNKISDAIDSGQPIDLQTVGSSCHPLIESVKSNQYKDVLSGVRKHHNYTYVHSLRVATYLSLFGNAVGMQDDQMKILSVGGLLHDVGKIATPHHVLNKPDKLNEKEWGIMKGHVDHSKKILSSLPEVSESIRVIAEQHHEKIDGSGYPLGLKGKQLNELARMATIVDIFVALTDERSYKPAYPEDTAFSILETMGPGLDQRMVKSFREIIAN